MMIKKDQEGDRKPEFSHANPQSKLHEKTANRKTLELIAAIRAGNSEAFSHFYMGYIDSLVGFLTRILGNEEDAKEIAQDTFALLWENRENLNPHTTLNGFVCGMARNLAIDLIRAKNKEQNVSSDIQTSVELFSDSADEQIISREIDLLVQTVILKMPPQRRAVYKLSREEGMTYHEIAKRLNISYGTVHSHMKAALKDIRSTLPVILVLLLFS